MNDVVKLLRIQEAPLDVAEVYDAVRSATAGGIACFIGSVRDHDSGRSVRRLGYSAHPGAIDVLREVAEQVHANHAALAIAAVHRTGNLEVGDDAVVVAVSCAHRGEAFAACHELIDELKARVPIWKHQLFEDGSEEWVGTP